MSRLLLVTGGCRSGKSAYALKRAEAAGTRRLFLATCPVTDAEMTARIERHRRERTGRGWETREEQTDPGAVVRAAADFDVVLLDCLGLWVNNLLFAAGETWPEEDEIVARCSALAEACSDHPGTVVVVTNEVGMSIVPENALARRYRDLLGRANQVVADRAEEVVLLCCGQPLVLKAWWKGPDS